MGDKVQTLTIDPKAMGRLLAMIAAVLGVAHLGVVLATAMGHDYLFGLGPLFSLGEELNLPSYYSTVLILISAALTLLVHSVETTSEAGKSKYWLGLFAGLLFMAYDEAFSVHERLMVPMRHLLGDGRHLGFFYFAWVLPFGALVLLLAIWFLPFLKTMESHLRRDCILAAACYLGGAVGVEMLEAPSFESHGSDISYLILVFFEEMMEMAGMILYSTAIARYLARRYGSVSLRFS